MKTKTHKTDKKKERVSHTHGRTSAWPIHQKTAIKTSQRSWRRRWKRRNNNNNKKLREAKKARNVSKRKKEKKEMEKERNYWKNLSERQRLASLRISSGLLDTGGTVEAGTFRSTERNEAIRSTRTLPKLRGLIVRPELRLSIPKETAMFLLYFYGTNTKTSGDRHSIVRYSDNGVWKCWQLN